MDLLFQRYADPFLFLDQLIECGQFQEGLCKISRSVQEDKLFQMYLHSTDFSISFNEWKREVLPQDEDTFMEADIEEVDVEATYAMAKEILDNFIPPGKEA